VKAKSHTSIAQPRSGTNDFKRSASNAQAPDQPWRPNRRAMRRRSNSAPQAVFDLMLAGMGPEVIALRNFA
jgi:hypothetical protein